MHAMCIIEYGKWATSGKSQKIRDHDKLLKERKYSELTKFPNSIETSKYKLSKFTGAVSKLDSLRIFELECLNLEVKAF